MTNHLTIFLLILTLLSCKNNDKQENTSSTKDLANINTANKSADNRTSDDYFKIGKDSTTILPFEIEVSLSPKANERITKGKETLIVTVFFTGTPKDSSNAELEEDESFFVASTKKEIPYGQWK
jgi:hypothetical protein